MAQDSIDGDLLHALSQVEDAAPNAETLIRMKDEVIARFPETLVRPVHSHSARPATTGIGKNVPEHVELQLEFADALAEMDDFAETAEQLIALKDELIKLNQESLEWIQQQEIAVAKASTTQIPLNNRLVSSAIDADINGSISKLDQIFEMQLAPEERVKQIDDALAETSK